MQKRELHVVSTGRQDAEEFASIVRVIHPYIDAIHIREKQRTAIDIYQIVNLLVDYNVPLSKIIINDRIDVASVTNIHGVQLAYHSIPVEVVKKEFSSLRVGRSVHSIEEAERAQAKGADYLFFGHVFPTDSKPGLKARGLEQLKEICQAVSIPVVAIGGIKPSNSQSVIRAGAAGIAVMSGILEAESPVEVVKEYHRKLFI